MNKNEIVLEILNVYDENEKLKNENARLSSNECCVSNESGRNLSEIEKTFINLGKESIIGRVLYSYLDIDLSEDDNGKPCVITFENWLERNIQKDRIPQNVSYLEFVDFMREDFKKYYNKKVKQALKNAGYDE